MQCVSHGWLLLFDCFSVLSGDYCDYETFEAACNSDETIIIGQADYGHISQGKCLKVDFGHFGCKADVSEVLGKQCSGRNRCSMNVQDEVLRNTEPCPVGLSLYLEVTYMCVKGNKQFCFSQSINTLVTIILICKYIHFIY